MSDRLLSESVSNNWKEGGLTLFTVRKTIEFAKFMVRNGILTISTALLIVFSFRVMLGDLDTTWQQFVPVFLFVLAITSLFFFVIYRQGRKLRSEQEQLANVFKHSSDGIFVVDRGVNIVRINPAAQKIMNLDEDEVPSNFCSMCSNYPGLNKLCSYQNCFVHETSSQPVELQLITPHGEVKSINASVSHYVDPMRGPLSVLRIQEVEEERLEEQHQISKMITHSILSAQENERKRISRELHDGIGQSLYSILIHSEMMKANLEDENQRDEDHIVNIELEQKLDSLQDSIRNTIEDIRDLSSELRPAALDDIGLVAALRNYFRVYGQKFGIQVHFKVEGESGRMMATLETAFYRIVQEALTNTAKYSHTEVVDVQLNLQSQMAKLQIRDYGIGFVITSELRQGVGLYSMEERVKILGGNFDIQSNLGQGTTILVQVPIIDSVEYVSEEELA